MSKSQLSVPTGFPKLLKEIKARIQQAQTRAILSANVELVRLYWDIGRIIDARQEQEGWGAAVIPRLAAELRNELPEVKGFSERNIKRMLALHRAYPEPSEFVQQPAAQMPEIPNFPPPRPASKATPKVPQAVAQLPVPQKVPQAVAQIDGSILWLIPWGHHVWLMDKVEPKHRLWYMQQTLSNGWSRNVLVHMIESQAHRWQGKAITNFERLLPAPQSDLIQQTLKDPYIFDFLTLTEPFHERELETQLLHQLERFLLELGQGFAFVGRQYPIQVGDKHFSIDLLFYHLGLRCFIVIDLKTGRFEPEFAGKMHFYLSVVDDKLRHAHDAASIGLILCQDRNQIVAEYALRGASQPIGVSEYELTRALPTGLRSALPSVEEIEAELADSTREPPTAKKARGRKVKPQSRNKPPAKRRKR